ncbi:type II secretion system minor pseudopilin GspJ [Acinetobacter sp. 194]|uniref:type II secretion system minor pseudopilin GspJ n=1 Tax=Acinetobacter shaoyimingii TaxID=2715164 RepID=UPI00140A9654|nr:type II secretion system minor pseudopilin GspJ [Acinetobacter shaoyimingii]NHB57217.1 type II secretion system minor pseudopilin GspJ [Acinetobacter shaoyimingii]
MNDFKHSNKTLNNKNKRKTQEFGFTLVELLVSIAIFAVLSALGWNVFDYLLKVRDRNAVHEEHLAALQDAYLQFQRDSLQIVPLTANIAGTVQPALVLNNQTLSFTKSGVSDPLQQGLSPYERIEYRYDTQQKKLYRLKYANINVSQTQQPVSSELLSNVDQFEITVLNPDTLTQWPDVNTDVNNLQNLRVLPRGLRIKLTVQDVEYEWMMSLLNTQFLKAQAKQSN